MITKAIRVDGDDYMICDGGDIRKRVEHYGLSTDTKPTNGVNNADIFYEMDTQKVYLFDADSSKWLEQ